VRRKAWRKSAKTQHPGGIKLGIARNGVENDWQTQTSRAQMAETSKAMARHTLRASTARYHRGDIIGSRAASASK